MNKKLVEQIKSNFKVEFKTNPILVFAPGRINLIGEHTDYNNGFVFPAAIDKGIVTAIQKSNTDTSSIIALDIKEQYQFLLKNIQAIEDGGWKNYVIGVVAEIQKTGKTIEPFNLVFGGDIPIGSGLSSSAALENSVVYGLNELFALNFTKEEMIYISQKAEHNYVGVKCGIMDQYASMFGQENVAILLDCENLNASTINLNLGDYELLLINTNVKHSLVESVYNQRRSACERVASILQHNSLRETSENDLLSIKDKISDEDFQKALYVIQENKRVLQAFDAIKNNDIKLLGNLLYGSHIGLQKKYKVSCNELDFLVEQTNDKPEILGARMMGGGFGGCTINLIKKNSKKVLNQITKAYQSKFNIQPSVYHIKLSDGVKILKG